jgi:hypothetical protein
MRTQLEVYIEPLGLLDHFLRLWWTTLVVIAVLPFRVLGVTLRLFIDEDLASFYKNYN